MLTGKEGHQTLRRHVGIGSPHSALGSQAPPSACSPGMGSLEHRIWDHLRPTRTRVRKEKLWVRQLLWVRPLCCLLVS